MGWGTRKEVKNNTILKWIADRATKTRLTASVCTGSSLLGKAGLLEGREATTHWRTFDFLRDAAPNAKIREDLLFTLDYPIYTSAGVSAGIDLALRIVSHFFGTKIGQATARKWNILIRKTISAGAILKRRTLLQILLYLYFVNLFAIEKVLEDIRFRCFKIRQHFLLLLRILSYQLQWTIIYPQ